MAYRVLSIYWGRLGWDNDNIAFWIISQRFLPPAIFIVPFLLLYNFFSLVDTYAGLIIAYTMFNIPFAVWIMRDFFNNLPVDLEESARVDGATRWQAFYRIVLPLSAPGLVAVAIFFFHLCLERVPLRPDADELLCYHDAGFNRRAEQYPRHRMVVHQRADADSGGAGDYHWFAARALHHPRSDGWRD